MATRSSPRWGVFFAGGQDRNPISGLGRGEVDLQGVRLGVHGSDRN